VDVGTGVGSRGDKKTRPRKLLPRLLNLIIILGSLAGLVWLVVTQHDELGHALAGVAHAKLRLVVFAVLCERASMIAFARVQVRLLRAGGQRLTLAEAVGLVFAGNALSLSVPIAGPGLAVAFTYRELDRRQVKHHAAAFALAISGVLSTVSLALIVAAALLASGNPVAAILGLLPATAIVGGIAAVLLSLRVPAWRRRLERIAAGGVRVAQRLRRKSGEPPETVVAGALRQLADLHLRRRDWIQVVVLSFANWLADAGCLSLSIRAAGLHCPLRDLLLVWSTGQAAGSLAFTPGGVGIVEAALIAAMVAVKMPAAKAAVAVMIYRLISLWLLVVVGWIFYFAIRSRRAKRTAAQTPPALPVMRRRVGVAGDHLGVLGRGVDGLHRDPAGPEEPDPDAAVAPPVVPEGEAPVARVLQVQGHPDRHVPVQQGAGLDQQALAGLQVADEGVARRVQQQQPRSPGRAEHVAELAHRVVGLLVIPAPGGVPHAGLVPVVPDVPRRGQEPVLAHPDLLVVLQRQRDDLARVVVGQRDVTGAPALDHDQRQPGQLPVPRAAHRHVGQLGLGLAPQQHVVREVDPVVRREVELRDGDGGTRDLDMGLAELEPGHVLDRRLLDPPGVADR
jgi:putative heme transporter